MTIPTPRAALKQLLARLDETTDKGGPVPAWMDSYCTAVQALKAEQEGDEGDDAIDRWIESRPGWPDDWPAVTHLPQLTALIGEALEHWGRPATPPAPGPGEMPSDELMGQWRNAAFAECRSGGEPTWRTLALLAIAWARQQQATELAALREVPVAVGERLPEPNAKVLAHYYNELGKGRTICAIWVPAKTRVGNSDIDEDLGLEYDDETDQFYWPEGWYETIENWEEFGYLKVYEGEVSYWQPLPKWPANAIPQPAPQAGEGL